MDLKDKLNFIWKFTFLGVFTYAVIMMTCCSSNCSSSCDSSKTKQCSSTKMAKQRSCRQNWATSITQSTDGNCIVR